MQNPNEEYWTPKEPSSIPGFDNFGHVNLQGVLNTRDLGGMPAGEGKRIRKRKLLRSGDLSKASSSDIKQLIDMHDMECVVDFRSKTEIEAEPDPLPLMQGVQYEFFPVLSSDSVIALSPADLLSESRLAREFMKHPFDAIANLYNEAIFGELGMDAYTNFLHTLLENENGAVLWHCTQGKDRTGIGAILVEHCLGVPLDYIHDDYLATNLFISSWMERIMEFLEKHDLAKSLDKDMAAYTYANDFYFATAMKAFKNTFGSIDNYLDKALDFDADKRAKLRELYLE